MNEHVSDEHIAASVREAESLIAKLQLTDAERAWAKEQAKTVMKIVTDRFLDSGSAFAELRVVAAPAAIANALVLVKDWASASEKLGK